MNNKVVMNNGFCKNCGQKMTNPKYCLHCGAQTELFKQEQEDKKIQNAKEKENESKTSFKKIQKVYFIMLGISIVILIFASKYLYLGLTVGAIALITNNSSSKAYAVVGFGVPLIYYLVFWIISFKTFIISVINIKYEKSLSTIGTAVLSAISIVRVGLIMLLICIVLSYLLTMKDIINTALIFFM
jgi:hypothetical protein